jgi:glutamate synthase (NADPH/NADH) small chain
MAEQAKKKKVKPGEIPRQAMPEQAPEDRARNWSEVPYGYPDEKAIQEAKRCLECKKPLCVDGCPVNIDIPGFVRLVQEGRFLDAARKIKEQNALPAVCGRVCPQEEQCESRCVLGKKHESVAIGRLERFVADYERNAGAVELPKLPPATGKRVAIVGAGPAGLTVAGDLIRLGHKVTVFEALHGPGGVLMYGIPEFRLPKEIVRAEVDYLERLGAEFVYDYVIGRNATVRELLDEEGYHAVFIGTGAGLPSFMGIPGENLIGVYSANEYLTRANLMKAYDFPRYDTPPIKRKRVAVIGGGNVAMDSARIALRLGGDVTIVYRRAREQMPARDEEIHHAEEEGVKLRLLNNPLRIIGDEGHRVTAMEVIKMELGEPDDSGRRRPVPVEGSEWVMEVDTVVVAIGNKPNPLVPQTTSELEVTRWGTVVAEDHTMQTSMPGVYAGGDIVSGAATVILAMGQAKIASRAIDHYLKTGRNPDPPPPPEEKKKKKPPAKVDKAPKAEETEKAQNTV